MTGIYKLFLNSSGCQDVACLRSLPTEAIVAANQDLLFDVPSSGWLGPMIGYGPVLDGDLVPDLPDRLLQEGKYQRSVERVLTASMANDGLYNTVCKCSPQKCERFSTSQQPADISSPFTQYKPQIGRNTYHTSWPHQLSLRSMRYRPSTLPT